MAYTSWEITSGDTLNEVVSLSRHILNGMTTFDASSKPTLLEVEMFITGNYYMMTGVMNKYGLSGAQTAVPIVNILKRYLVMVTVCDIESTAPSAGFGPGKPNSRRQFFCSKMEEFEKYMAAGNIQSMTGAVLLADGDQDVLPLWTGTSLARKRLLSLETDSVQPQIVGGMMDNNRSGSNGNSFVWPFVE